MTDCRHCQDDLKAYADGELPLGRRLAVRRHLSRCESCRKEFRAMQQITDELRATEGTEPLSPNLRAKILGNAPLTSRSGGAARWPSAWRLAAAGAIVFVLCVVLFPVFSTSREKARNVTAYTTYQSPIAFRNTAPAVAQDTAPEAVPYLGGGRIGAAANPPHVIAPSALANASPGDSSLAAALSLNRQVHKEATIGVEVKNAEASSDQVTEMVKSAGGFVADNTLATGDDGTRSADLTVKVPVAQFETTLGQIAKLGDVQAKNITGQDITEKTSDADQAEAVLEDEAGRADARLKTLGKKAGWRDQQAARDTRIELAQARARLELLKKMAVLSTISVHLSEKPKPAAAPPVTSGFLGGLGDTTRAATGSLLASAGALLALLIWVLAYAPLWLPLALIGRSVYRHYWGRPTDSGVTPA